jgi:16S rRNA (guanine966-N2)-methyltransferase
MKLTGGRARGRRLRTPRVPGLRPTSARVREALFDIVGARVVGARFLDVFAGSGAVGIEALSRGAARAVFVESDPHAARALEANLVATAAHDRGMVMLGDAGRTIGALGRRAERFDIVFLDPPYATGAPGDLLRAAARLVKPGGVLILECARTGMDTFPDLPGLRAGRRYRYGDSALLVSHRDAGAGPE